MSDNGNVSTTSTTKTSTKVIVLTGASGYLGQHCVRALIELGYDDNPGSSGKASQIENCGSSVSSLIIYALVHQPSSKTELHDAITSYYEDCDEQLKRHYQQNVTVMTVALDLTSPTACDEWFEWLASQNTISDESKSITIDCCIHTAALSSPSICEQQPEYAMSLNVPTFFLHQLFQNNPAITIIALSTDQVYEGNISCDDSEQYYNESSNCEPCNIYGTTKVALESYLINQQVQYPKASVLMLRSSIILGPNAPFLPEKAHATFLHFCYSRIHERTTYYTNEIRSVIAVSDVVKIIVKMMDHYGTAEMTTTMDRIEDGDCEVFCMGGPTPVNRYEMAKAVISFFHVADTSNDIAVPVFKEQTPGTTVKSPLNISMDSAKLVHFMSNKSTTSAPSSSVTVGFLSLSNILVQTFADPLIHDKQCK